MGKTKGPPDLLAVIELAALEKIGEKLAAVDKKLAAVVVPVVAGRDDIQRLAQARDLLAQARRAVERALDVYKGALATPPPQGGYLE